MTAKEVPAPLPSMWNVADAASLTEWMLRRGIGGPIGPKMAAEMTLMWMQERGFCRVSHSVAPPVPPKDFTGPCRVCGMGAGAHSIGHAFQSSAPPVLSEEDREWHTEAEVFGPKMFESYHQLRAAGHDEAWVYAKLGIDFKTDTLPPLADQWKPRGNLRDMAWRICALQGHDDGEPLNPCPACQAEIRDYFFPPAACSAPSVVAPETAGAPQEGAIRKLCWQLREAAGRNEMAVGDSPKPSKRWMETDGEVRTIIDKIVAIAAPAPAVLRTAVEGMKDIAYGIENGTISYPATMLRELAASFEGRLSEEVQKERTNG